MYAGIRQFFWVFYGVLKLTEKIGDPTPKVAI